MRYGSEKKKGYIAASLMCAVNVHLPFCAAMLYHEPGVLCLKEKLVAAVFCRVILFSVFFSSALTVCAQDVTHSPFARMPQGVFPEMLIDGHVPAWVSKERASSGGASPSSPYAIKIPVLIYHSVRPHRNGESEFQDRFDVTPELLESELRYIKDNGYTTVTFRDIVANFSHGTPLPERPVILSFDDGWKNQYKYAFPLLKKYGMKGVFFVYTTPLYYKNSLWMTWDEVRELDAAGMEIGGHSRTHPALIDLSTDAELDNEIGGGKAIIERELGHPIAAFAYPFGAKNKRVIEAVRRAGFSVARTTVSGLWNDPEHALEFHGTDANDSLEDFKKLLKK